MTGDSYEVRVSMKTKTLKSHSSDLSVPCVKFTFYRILNKLIQFSYKIYLRKIISIRYSVINNFSIFNCILGHLGERLTTRIWNTEIQVITLFNFFLFQLFSIFFSFFFPAFLIYYLSLLSSISKMFSYSVHLLIT